MRDIFIHWKVNARVQIRKIITLASMLAVAWHVLLTIAYTAPTNAISYKHGNVITKYMESFFKQDWHLFSPNPMVSDSFFWARCMDDSGAWTQWMDPMLPLRDFHYKSRITGAGKVLFIIRHLSDRLIDLSNQERIDNRSIVDTEDYKNAASLVTNFCKSTDEKNILAEFRVLTFYPPKYSHRHHKKDVSAIREYKFPVIRLGTDRFKHEDNL